MSGNEDQDLIEQLQAGSLEALGILYDRHRHMVYRTAVAISADREAANDLLQDVFLRLYRYADHINPLRPLEPWLYRITANLSYTWVKRNHRGLHLIDEMADWFVSGTGKSSPSSFSLYYLNDLSLLEISETLDIPVGTVKSRLHYGRLALQKALQAHQIESPWLSELKYEST